MRSYELRIRSCPFTCLGGGTIGRLEVAPTARGAIRADWGPWERRVGLWPARGDRIDGVPASVRARPYRQKTSSSSSRFHGEP